MGVLGAFKEKTKTRVTAPKLYRVVMHNDDFTTMEFVVHVLVDIFRKELKEAKRIMMAVHKKGSAVVGRYPYDVARTKAQKAMELAHKEGFPFRLTVEEDV